jgi:hypothetical protein
MQISRRSIVGFVVLAEISLSSCSRAAPSQSDLLGTWSNPRGGQIELTAGGRATVRDVPTALLISPSSSGIVSGNGFWSMAKGQPSWTSGAEWWNIRISLKNVSTGQGPLETEIHYAKEDGKSIIFMWKGEEGGEREEYFKK